MSSNNTNVRINSNKKGGLLMPILIGLVGIVIVFYLYSLFVGYLNFKKTSPYLINGMISATTPMQFSASQIKQPTSSAFGVEFTYSTWLYINDTNFASNSGPSCNERSMFHVFHKGSYDYIPNHSSSSTSSFYYPLLQNPGVWLYPNTNKLHIRFNTFENVVESSDVGNIPLNMWVNLIIVLIGGSVDVYINGNLKKRTKLTGVPKINYGDLYITHWGGYQGNLSNLRYFNYAIQPYIVDQIFRMGPNLTVVTENNSAITATANLSPNYWMTTGFPNSFASPNYNQNSQTTT